MANELAPGRKLKTRDLAPSDLADLKPRSKIWIERSGEVVMSDWRLARLEAIARTSRDCIMSMVC